MPKFVQGFTLIELLVVIAIMATVGVLAMANYGSFGEDQKLKQGALDISSILKTSQTNASGNILCNGVGGAKWIVKFTDLTSIDLVCLPPGGSESSSIRNINLSNQNLSLTTIINGSDCTATLPVKVTYDPLTALMTFSDSSAQSCITSATSLTVGLNNTKSNGLSTVTIKKGGTVDVQ